MTIAVALIDDHPAVISGLERILDRESDVIVVGTAGSLAEARPLLGRDDVDVALVDIRLGDGVGTELIEEAAAHGRPATIVLSSFDHPQYVSASVRLGAQGFLLKTAPLQEVVEAIRRVAGGGTAFTAEQLREAQRPSIALSDRERSIIRLLIKSRSNDEIARELGLSRKTIEAHLTRMFERFGALSRTELAVRGHQEGWVDL